MIDIRVDTGAIANLLGTLGPTTICELALQTLTAFVTDMILSD
jgi:hypothetical protein